MSFLSKTKAFWAAVLFLISIMPISVQAGLTNGGFESGLADWTTSPTGTVAPVGDSMISGVLFEVQEGDWMASLSYPGFSGDLEENYIRQKVEIEENSNYLSFFYNFWSFDEGNYDGFVVSITGGMQDDIIMTVDAGDIAGAHNNDNLGDLDYTGWKFITFDISGFYNPARESNITISFFSGNTGDDSYPSGVFIDDVKITEYEPPVVHVPTSMLLMASGLLGFVGLRRKVNG